MDERKLKNWYFHFYLSTDDPNHLISESYCDELLGLIAEWTDNNDISVTGGYSETRKPKYTLKELLDKCDPSVEKEEIKITKL